MKAQAIIQGHIGQSHDQSWGIDENSYSARLESEQLLQLNPTDLGNVIPILKEWNILDNGCRI